MSIFEELKDKFNKINKGNKEILSMHNYEEDEFPVRYNSKDYYEDDCDDLFLSFYHGKFALRFDGSVYVSDGICVFPNGESYDEKE